jgi:hypothetical protein
MWYHYRQNNTRGTFDEGPTVAPHVLIEANSADEANERAQKLGMYFEGVRQGRDCVCCGDRWSPAVLDSEGYEHVTDVALAVEGDLLGEWFIAHGVDGRVVRSGGRVVEPPSSDWERLMSGLDGIGG